MSRDEPGRLILITGQRGDPGKTDWCLALAEAASTLGIPTSGLVSPAVFEGDRTIKFEIKALSPAYGDISLMKQVLVNLLSNAIKFTQSKDIAVIEVGNRIEENKNIYYVQDNGIGFDSQHTDKLFAPFNRLPEAKEFEGTGIGLSIVERIINRHGGQVWAEGKINDGATFYFSFPDKT